MIVEYFGSESSSVAEDSVVEHATQKILVPTNMSDVMVYLVIFSTSIDKILFI